MPNIMVHEKVGYDISKIMNVNSYDYYLGLLAPDAPNLFGFAPKEERWTSHQRRKDRKEWRKALDAFYKEEKDHYPKDFLMGYYIHVLTDIVYDDFFYDIVKEKILKDFDTDNYNQIMRDDMGEYYFKEIRVIKNILQEKNTSYDILNITKDELLKWKEKEISTWKNEMNCKYITEDIIKQLEEQVLIEYKIRIGQ